MMYTFTDMSEGGRSFWAAQHPDSTAVGYGKSKFKAARHCRSEMFTKMFAARILKDILLPTPRDYPMTP